MTNKKSLLFVMTIMVLIIGISAASAADISGNDTVSYSDSTHNTIENDNSQQVNLEGSGVKISESVSNDVKTNDVDANKEILKTQKSTKSAGSTIVINNATFNDYFEDTYLNDKVSDGDTLDFQGLINGSEYRMNINKSVNIISSTHDSLISLNTSATSLFGDEDVVSFTLLEGASNSNVTGINFYNTQIFIRHAHDIKINNITAKVEEQKVGSGVGQTSIRDNSTRIIVENSTFSTQNNGGSSTVVLAWANNCTIRNNNITGIGFVGNLIYLTTYNVDGINELETVNDFNIIENNLLTGPAKPESICYGIAISGKNNTVVNNTIHYNGTGITTQWVTDERALSINTLIANNTLDGCSLYTFVNSTVYGNTVSGTNGVLMLNPSANIYNNTVENVNLDSNCVLVDTVITGNVAIPNSKHNMTIANCTIEGNLVSNDTRSTAAIPSNANITNNNVKGAIELYASSNFIVANNTVDRNITIDGRRNNNQNLLIENNTIITDEEYAIDVLTLMAANINITNNYLISSSYSGNDAVYVYREIETLNVSDNRPIIYNLNETTYSTYFNDDGTAKENIVNETVLVLTGDIEDKDFIFTDVEVTIINGGNNSLINSSIIHRGTSKVTIESIDINNPDDVYEFIYELTEDNYSQYFDEEGIIRKEAVVNESALVVAGDINNKEFTFDGVELDFVNGEEYVLSNASIIVTNDAQVNIDSLIINNTNDNNPIIYLGSSDNQLTNTIITAQSNEPIHGIDVESDNNIIDNVTINLVAPVSDTAWNADYSIGTVPTAGIFIRSSNNIVNNTKLNLNSTENKGYYSSLDAIDIQSKEVTEKIENNTIVNTQINLSGEQYLYGVNIARSINTTVDNVTINLDSIYYADGVQVGDSIDTKIVSSNINANATQQAFAVYLTAMASGTVNNITISNITANVEAEDATVLGVDGSNGIEFTDSVANITSNITNAIYFLPDWMGFKPTNILVNNVTINSNDKNENSTLALLNEVTNATITNSVLTATNGGALFINGSDVLVDSNLINVTSSTTANISSTSSNVNITNNALYASELEGDISAVSESTSDIIIADNNVLNNIITITGDLTVFTPSTIDISITDLKNNTINYGSIEVTVNGEKQDATLTNGLAQITYTPTTTDDINVTAVFTSVTSLQITNDTALPVNKANVTISIDEQTTKINETVVLNATITASGDIKVNDGIVVFTDEEGNIIGQANVTDSVATINTTYDKAGSQVVIVNYTNSTLFNIANNNTTITVNKLDTTISINSTNTTKINSNITIDGVLADENGNPIASKDIQVTINDNTTNVTTDEEGKYAIDYTATKDGVVEITVEFAGDEIYSDSTNNTTVEVTKYFTTITVNPVNGVYNETVELTANVVDEDGNPVTGGSIIFKINGQTLKDENGTMIKLSLKDGVATTTYVAPKSWIKDNLTISAVYAGNSIYNASRSENSIVNISNRSAQLQIITDNITAKSGQTIKLVVLVTENGKLIDGGNVIFKLNGVTVKDADGKTLTAKVVNGIATVDYTIPEGHSAKEFTLTAVYSNAGYARLEQTGSLTIEKSNVFVEVEPVITTANKTTITAKIVGESRNNIKGSTQVVVKVNGKSAGSTTAVDGVINFTIDTPYKVGYYDLVIIAGENNRYNSGRTTSVLIMETE